MKEVGSNYNVLTKLQLREFGQFSPNMAFCICIDGAFMGRLTSSTAFDEAI